jgi:hypothetical protein
VQSGTLSQRGPLPCRAGELDAVLSSGDAGAGAELWAILPHFTEVNHAMPLSIATIDLAA